MKKLLFILAVGLSFSGVTQAAPVNSVCPVGARPVRNDVVVKYKGDEVALCCNNCKKKFEADPGKYADKIVKK